MELTMQSPGDAIGLCECGRVLYPSLNHEGKRIGVTHHREDEDHHLTYWSTDKIIERIKSN